MASAATTPGGSQQVVIEIVPEADLLSTEAETKHLLISLKTPRTNRRVPVDVVVVLDISASMGTEATIQSAAGATESHGLSLLDVAKHGVKTMIATLGAQDRLGLVAFNHAAHTVFDLLIMDEKGQEAANRKVDEVHESGCTDIWQGLHSALDMLMRARYRRCQSHITLLTDGVSQNKDTIVAKLQAYKKSEARSLPGSINTFGFGYNLDSHLLIELAREGTGLYSFIPDAGFVGTVFVNAMSNLLVMFGVRAVLNLELEGQENAKIDRVWGGFQSETSDHGSISIGGLQYEQSRDVIVEVRGLQATVGEDFLLARVTYNDLSGASVESELGVGTVTAPSPEQAAFVARHKIRSRYVETVRKAMAQAEANNFEGAAASIAALASLAATEERPREQSFEDLLEDINGQTAEAFSKREWYYKWGRHYAPSIALAHALQQCNNFKDPGVQHYGGELFRDVQNQADRAFSALPAPKSSGRTRGHGGGSSPRVAPVSMAAYNDRYRG